MSERAAKDHARICKPVISPMIVIEDSTKDFVTFQTLWKREDGT